MEHIGSALGQILRQSGLLEGIRRQKMIKAWAEIVGKDFASHTRASRISRETLWIEAAGSSWSARVMMVRREILQKYREKFGELPFRDIRVTVGVFSDSAGVGNELKPGD
jgi:predicted nucleic acid-binding Zn ribbon protein